MWLHGSIFEPRNHPNHATIKLLGLAMQRVLAATRAEFFEFQPVGIVAAIFLGGVIALFAVTAL
jgi:hypothetical protein